MALLTASVDLNFEYRDVPTGYIVTVRGSARGIPLPAGQSFFVPDLIVDRFLETFGDPPPAVPARRYWATTPTEHQHPNQGHAGSDAPHGHWWLPPDPQPRPGRIRGLTRVS